MELGVPGGMRKYIYDIPIYNCDKKHKMAKMELVIIGVGQKIIIGVGRKKNN